MSKNRVVCRVHWPGTCNSVEYVVTTYIKKNGDGFYTKVLYPGDRGFKAAKAKARAGRSTINFKVG